MYNSVAEFLLLSHGLRVPSLFVTSLKMTTFTYVTTEEKRRCDQ